MCSSGLDKDRRIAELLPVTWPAFFAKHGRLTPVQREAIPKIRRGADVLVCSGTASGKTEAVCAPLVERYIHSNGPWTILYISPTRALANDLYERLSGPLRQMGLRAERRTGDHRWKPSTDSPQLLLTTPESLDSMLCRGRIQGKTGHALAPVCAVVLDEIHLLHGAARGEQVRWLLTRLYRLKQQARRDGWTKSARMQVVALSATIPDPGKVAETFLRNEEIIDVGGAREIHALVDPLTCSGVVKELPALLSGPDSPQKILVFCNSRRRAEDLALELKDLVTPLGYSLLVHHGSLGKSVREDAESEMKSGKRPTITVSTSTLELGVDIGDIDLVVLDGPAHDVSSLLQRIGRGNRRTSKTQVLPCANSVKDRLVQAAMLDAARLGHLGVSIPGPEYAVVRQQIASYIYQGAKRSRSEINLKALFTDCAFPHGEAILQEMQRRGELIREGDGYRLGDEWLRKTDTGAIHSNIEAPQGSQVVDSRSGKVLARNVVFRGGRSIRTGGKRYRVEQRSEYTIKVSKTNSSAADGSWGYTGRFNARADGHALAIRDYLGLSPNEWPILVFPDGTYVFHLLGPRCALTLELLTSYARPLPDERPSQVNGFYAQFHLCDIGKPQWMTTAGSALLERQVRSRLSEMENRLGRPYANRLLPFELRVDEVLQWMDVPGQLTAIAESQWIKVEGEREEVLRKLLGR